MDEVHLMKHGSDQVGQQATAYFDSRCTGGNQYNRVFGFEIGGEKFSRSLIFIHDAGRHTPTNRERQKVTRKIQVDFPFSLSWFSLSRFDKELDSEVVCLAAGGVSQSGVSKQNPLWLGLQGNS
jgi:hypothetical protein